MTPPSPTIAPPPAAIKVKEAVPYEYTEICRNESYAAAVGMSRMYKNVKQALPNWTLLNIARPARLVIFIRLE